MNRFVRGIVAGSLIGATVGVVMLMRRNQSMTRNMKNQSNKISGRARGTVRMVRDSAKRWTSAVKDGTEAFSRKLANRIS